ncbi:MAG: antA/AntB antirepressor family protein [Cetobacterium sp.]
MDMILNVSESKIGQIISARELYNFLEVKSNFRDWIARRIVKYGFKENEDFIATAQKRATAQGNMTTESEYLLTMDMAKELSMIENNEKGRQARKYFIACEKNYLHMLEARLQLLEPKNKTCDFESREWQLLKGSANTIITLQKKNREDLQEIARLVDRVNYNNGELFLYAKQVIELSKNLEIGDTRKNDCFITKR